MRSLTLQVQITMDGFVAGPNGEMDWMTVNWDPALIDYTQALTDAMDCIVLGRKMAEGFIPHWASVAADPAHPDVAVGNTFTDTPKVVATHTLDQPIWPNTELAKGDLSDEIDRLKNQPGQDIIVYGGATFVSSLIKRQLIDAYHLYVNPIAIGNGMPIFDKLSISNRLTLRLVKATPFECGIVVMHYQQPRS